MRSILVYVMQVIIASGVLYGYYHLFLRNKRFHQYNRFYLLATTLLSLMIPLLHVDVYFSSSDEIPAVYQLLSEVRANNNTPIKTFSVNWPAILQFSYWLITILLIIRLISGLRKLVRLKEENEQEKLDEILFIQTTEKGTPFSFFNWLFWNQKIELQSPAGGKIFRHEIFHIQQKHSWDVLYLELLSILFWINPFFHIIKKETKAIHEFLADRFAAGRDNEWDYAELLVMQTLQTRQQLVNPFFHNQIKRRIAMITNSSKPGFQYLRKIMVLPLVALLVTIIAVNCTAKKEKEEIQEVPQTKEKLLKLKLAEIKLDMKNGIAAKTDSIVFEKIKNLKLQLIKEEPALTIVDEPASFPGGQPAWSTFIQKYLNPVVPADHGAPAGTYKVIVQFIVGKDGKISDLKPVTQLGYGMEEEVIRFMKLSPDWIPAKKSGENVNAYIKQPVTFMITEE